jgi:DNA ligase (NAD+)
MTRRPSDDSQASALQDEAQELAQLAAEIRHHEARYRDGAPEITDAAFDDLVGRYGELADELGLGESERLDARPGADHTEGFQTVEHRIPMLSLEKLSPSKRDSDGTVISPKKQLDNWYDRRHRDLEITVPGLALVVEPKVDGISVSVSYDDGRLVRAVTRGNGKTGDDITRQVRTARAVPETLKGLAGQVEIRGELYWPRAAFEAYNALLEKTSDKLIVNPRNGCAGLMKRKDPTGLEHVGVRSFLYQVAWAKGCTLPDTQHGVAWRGFR